MCRTVEGRAREADENIFAGLDIVGDLVVDTFLQFKNYKMLLIDRVKRLFTSLVSCTVRVRRMWALQMGVKFYSPLYRRV